MKQLVNGLSRVFYMRSLGLLLIRVAAGAIFLHHGWMKFQNIPGMLGFMGTLGIPEWLAYAAMWTELVGGAMLILGVASRIAGIGTGVVALVAACAAIIPMKGFVGAEFELLLAAVSFGIALAGSGEYALFRMECRACGGMLCMPGSPDCPGKKGN